MAVAARPRPSIRSNCKFWPPGWMLTPEETLTSNLVKKFRRKSTFKAPRTRPRKNVPHADFRPFA